MRVSIVTVCKNAAKHLEKTIKSVISQTYNDIEYIIVDGDSQDGTKDIVHQYSDKISKFISEPDNGLYEAMNKGIRYSSGSYINFLNSNDYLLDDRVIEDVVNFVAKYPSCDYFYGNLQVRAASGETVLVKPPTPDRILEELVHGALPHQASFARAELFFSKIGFFNENYRIASDYEWSLRLMQDETLDVRYFPRTITSYYEEGLSSNLRLSLPEVFDIQNSYSLYQTEYWLKKRIQRLQEVIFYLRLQLQDLPKEQPQPPHLPNTKALTSEYQALKRELEQAYDTIAAMKTSKFWKARTLWFRLKKALGMPLND